MRRMHDSRFATKYFVGRGIDVGSGDDCLDQYSSLFPLMEFASEWDKDDGDAQYMAIDYEWDFLYSSHCLEHLENPWLALRNWCKVVKKGGYLVVMVPDEDMYEQGHWPSKYNGDHKHTFTMFKAPHRLWSKVSINVLELIAYVSDLAECESVQRLTSTHLPNLPDTDQTLGIGECAIEFILKRI